MFSAACFDLLSMISSGKVNGREGIMKQNNMFEGLMEPSLSWEAFAFLPDID